MPLFEAIRLALRTIRTQKLKSFFSLVGVLIGVTFLIAVVSIVQGMNRYMVDRVALHYDGKVAKDVDLVGTEETYFRIRNYEVVAGRAFTAQEVRASLPVLVIGDEVARRLLAGLDP